MKRGVVLLAALVAFAIVIGGCGKPQTETIRTPNGDVKVTKTGEKSGTIEFEGKEGKTTVNVENKPSITEAELGVPVYPNATVENSSTHESSQIKMKIYALSTKDSFEDVSKFYKDNLKGVSNSFSTDNDNTKAATFQIGESMNGTVVSVVTDTKANKTIITVTRYMK